MKSHLALAVASLVTIQVLIERGLAQEPPPTAEDIRALRKKIEELEQKVKILEQKGQAEPKVEQLEQQVKGLQREKELADEAAETKAQKTPIITIGEQGFSFASADGKFGAQLKGLLQVDSRTFFDDAGIKGNDTFGLRRVRPILQGTVFRDFDFIFVPEFAPSTGPQIFDAWVNYKYNAALQLQAGKFKSPISLEYLQPDSYTLFNERGLTTVLAAGRDIGFSLHGDVLDGRVSYAAGIFNGVGDGRNSSNIDFEDDKSFEGRLFFQPFRKSSTAALQGIGIGVGGSYEDMQKGSTAGLPQTTGGTFPGFVTTGQQQFFAYNPTNKDVVVADGDHWRISPQGYYFYGPFSLLGEYVISDQSVSRIGTGPQPSAHLDNRAWDITVGWVLTGEDVSYSAGVIPRRNFDPRQGDWGAWQLVARYGELDVDRAAFPNFADPATSAHQATEWAVGLNWYLNRNVMVKSSFSHTTFSGGGGGGSTSPGIVTRKDENVLFTRFQLAF
jgi:phosphate-selective porin OprO/OprP